eukprot:366513-Chlamydomonas_euryale.AAC.1
MPCRAESALRLMLERPWTNRHKSWTYLPDLSLKHSLQLYAELPPNMSLQPTTNLLVVPKRKAECALRTEAPSCQHARRLQQTGDAKLDVERAARPDVTATKGKKGAGGGKRRARCEGGESISIAKLDARR